MCVTNHTYVHSFSNFVKTTFLMSSLLKYPYGMLEEEKRTKSTRHLVS